MEQEEKKEKRAAEAATRRLSPERATLRRRFERVFGKGLEPGIFRETEPEFVSAAESDEILKRLAAHSPASTRYVMKGEIGQGGMGSVFKVWDGDLCRNLAMKVILGKSTGAEAAGSPPVDRKTLERFLAEAQITAQLDHPGIVPVHELGLDDNGCVYFAMRLVQGQDLRVVFRKVVTGEDGWNETRVLGVLLRVCEAMAYAHSKQVVHRDLKPENIMVGRFGQTYVMDWGLARVMGQEDSRDLRIQQKLAYSRKQGDATGRDGDDSLVTMDGEIVGTPSYMSPEQALGKLDELGPRSDIYSLGCMLYHLLSGRIPYESTGEHLTPHAMLRRLSRGPPVPLYAAAEQVPVELAAICDKAMAYEIEDRYASMEELGSDLRAYLEGRVVRAYETGALAAMRKWTVRNRTLSLAVVAILVLTVLFVAGMYQQKNVAFANERRAQHSEGIALEESIRANENAVRFDRMWREAQEDRDRLLRLSDVKRLADLREEMNRYWPAHPDLVDEMEDWQLRAEELVGRSENHQETLAGLRGFGHPVEAEDGSVTYVFDDLETGWWHDTLAELVSQLEEFIDGDVHGQTLASMEARLDLARTLASRSLTEPPEQWREAIDSISDPEQCPLYGGLTIAPQMGLAPVRRNPDSGLWEFWHILSGEAPILSGSGDLELTEESGLVLVLIPGGRFWMGAQAEDPAGVNYDSRADPEESPPHEIDLDPYFLSKFEMTQAQWFRFRGENPSAYRKGLRFAGVEVTSLHPVEQVSWDECAVTLDRLGLVLPTEAQWEYACRGGTGTDWWCGDLLEELDQAANLADSFCKENGGPPGWSYEESLNDRCVVHAPVGSFRENPFGLLDTIGNVWEWCRDGLGDYSIPVRQGDGFRLVANARNMAFRGGAFSITADHARSSSRSGYSREYRFNSLGLRPARVLSGG
ncbi:MAG: bifunctional serine/threonine-protein kinase/formylglycine-generating enzyme family protein [Planctomycetota bacterium]